MNLARKQATRKKRIWRIRKKVNGLPTRPRLCINFSNKHVYAQCIDDEVGHTLVSLSSLSKEMREQGKGNNVDAAAELGKRFGEKAVQAGITLVVFDRHGRSYHGAVGAFADASRKAGLKF